MKFRFAEDRDSDLVELEDPQGDFIIPGDYEPEISYKFDGSGSFKLAVDHQWLDVGAIEGLIDFLKFAKEQLLK